MVEVDGATRNRVRGGGAGPALLDRPAPPGRDFGPELDVLRLGSDSVLAPFLPRMRFDLRDTPTVVVDVIEGRRASDLVVDGCIDPSVAAGLGAAIGAWHRGAAAYSSGFRQAPDTPEGSFDLRDPLLAAHLVALDREWQASTVIHGDLRAANAVLTAEPTGCGAAEVVLTRWARSGTGDPAWDLGCLVADLLASAGARGRAAAAEAAVSAAAASYGRTVGEGAWGDTFARRVVLSAVVRLVHLGSDPHRQELVVMARSVSAWLPTWTRRFEKWLA